MSSGPGAAALGPLFLLPDKSADPALISVLDRTSRAHSNGDSAHRSFLNSSANIKNSV